MPNLTPEVATLPAKWLSDGLADEESEADIAYNAAIKGCAAELKSSLSTASAVGCLTIARWRGSDAMVNHDFDYYGNLPDGSYSLYCHPQAPDAVRTAADSALACLLEHVLPIEQDSIDVINRAIIDLQSALAAK